MRPVEDMLNFLWKKTSRKSTGEPPLIIQTSSVNGDSIEHVHRFKQKAPLRPSSMYVEGNGGVSHPLQVSAATSLDEYRFMDACVNSNENHAGDVETRCRDMPFKNTSRNKSESQLHCIVDEPAKYYNSPKINSRHQTSTRNSGHSRSHSVFTNAYQVNSERTSVVKTEMEGTPRMYKKNPLNSNRIMAHYGGLSNVSFDGSTTGSCHSDSQGSQWSFWEDGCSDPVPPPRKRRNKPREAFSETSSQSSSDRADSSKLSVNTDDLDERNRRFENDSVSSVCVQDPMEFSLHLPPGFSDLGLDMLGAEFNAGEFNSDWRHTDQTNETPEQCISIEQDHVLMTHASTHEPDIRGADCSFSSVSSGHSDDTSVNIDSETLPQKTKLRSETIVKSLFTKGKQCPDSDSDPVESEEQTRSIVIDENSTLDIYSQQNHHTLPETIPKFTESEVNNFEKISEYQATRVERTTKKPLSWYHESSTDDVFYTPVSDETDWTIAFCTSGIVEGSCVKGTQPDVLIGTDQKKVLGSLSSLPTDSDQSFEAGQENDKDDPPCRLPTENEQVHDLVVFHQLRGAAPSSVVVKIGETYTSQDVIEQILYLEKLPADWYLHKLCTKSLDPKAINNGSVELDFRDRPVMILKQNHQSGNVRFELHQKDGIQIRVTCDAGLERTKPLVLTISCEEICGNVLDIAAQKFGLNSAAKLCLIQVERNEKGCPMKRVPENQIMARLHSDYFLLCEREFLAGSSDTRNHSFVRSARAESRSQSSYSHGNSSRVELDRLERKVADLETKLDECEKVCEEKLLKKETQLDHYRAIAFCTDPLTKVMLLETEMQRLTTEMLDQERQMQMLRDLYKTSSRSEYERKNLDDELTAMKKSLSAVEKERAEVYAFLAVARTEELETFKTSASESVAPPLFGVCHESQGSCLYALELNRSSLIGEEHLTLKNNTNHFGYGRNNDGLGLMEGDRILEVNGQLVHHLSEKELLSAVGKMTEHLHVVVLREQAPTTDIYVL